MKKIAVVANTSWNILNFRTSLIQELQKEYEVLLVAPSDGYSSKISKLAPTALLKNLKRKGTNPIDEYKLMAELKKVYKKNDVDLVLHFTIKPNIYGSMAAKQLKIPSIAVVTGLGYTFLSSGITAKVAKKLYKQAFKNNSMTVFQNSDDRSLFLKEALVVEDRSRVINGSGIDTDFFSPQKTNHTAEGFHFLFVGRLLYDKGVRELFQAFSENFSKHPNTKLHVVGDIDKGNPSAFSKTELDQVLQKYSNISYYGHVDEVKEMVANSDCVVLPSYREGLPRVMLEAISMAKPVITTDVAGCKEVVIDGKNGYLVRAQDSVDLGEKMKVMSQLSVEDRQTMGDKGRELAIKRFSCSVINKEFLKEVQDALNF